MGVSVISQSYRNLIASLNSFLFRLWSNSLRGITISQVDDPFSVANSTARFFAFVGGEFFTSSSLSVRQSSFFVCVLSCNVWIAEASGGWCCFSTIRLKSGLVTFIEASYSEDEVTTWSTNPRLPYVQGEVALYFSDCMVSDRWYENLINRALEWLKKFCNIR